VALPIWIEFMKAYMGDRPPTTTFDPPSNVVFVPVDPKTGRVTDNGTPGAIQEAFIAGTQPGVVLQP
jgi:penicillin-binding protein 1A